MTSTFSIGQGSQPLLTPAGTQPPLPQPVPPPLLSRRDAAAYLGVQPQTLAAWACTKRVKLPYSKLGRRVMYRRDDLDRFVQANLQFGTDEEVAS